MALGGTEQGIRFDYFSLINIPDDMCDLQVHTPYRQAEKLPNVVGPKEKKVGRFESAMLPEVTIG